MAKRVEVKTELTAEELCERYRKAREPVERTHWHILWLMKEGHTPKEVAERVGYTARWVRTIIGRYNRIGEQGISNHRLTLPGAKPLLSPEQQQELDDALQQKPSDDGLWSGPKVALWMQEKLGVPWTSDAGGITCSAWATAPMCPDRSMPRRVKKPSKPLKKLPEEVELIRQAHPQATVELWSGDEHRIGLKPILRRVWARKGDRVQAIVRQHYQWMHLYVRYHQRPLSQR